MGKPTELQKKIIKLLQAGVTQKEIAIKLKTNYLYVNRIARRIKNEKS